MQTTKEIIETLIGLGLTQAEITRKTKIPQPRLSRWTAGHIPNGADDALKLADLVKKQIALQRKKAGA